MAQVENPIFFPLFSEEEIDALKKENIHTVERYEQIKDSVAQTVAPKLMERIVFDDAYKTTEWLVYTSFANRTEVSTFSYNAEKNLQVVEKTSNGKLIEKMEFKYDENKRLKSYNTGDGKSKSFTNFYRYTADGKVSVYKQLRYTTYGMHLKLFEKKYNEFGLIEQEDVRDIKGEQPAKLVKQVFYKYDETKKLIEKTEVNTERDEEITEKYGYDENGKLTETRIISDSKVQYTSFTNYDTHDKLLTQKNVDATGKTIFEIVNKYTANGRLENAIERGKTTTETKNMYNAKNLLIEQIISTSGVIRKFSFQYK